MIPPNGSMQLRWFFGHADDSPFKDERLRQAFRYTWDIDAYNDALNNVAAFQDAGLPAESYWDTFLSSGSWSGWWLDPKGPDFGENAKYFDFNLDEAKALMEAAGVTDFPMPYNMVYAGPGPSSYPPFFFPRAEVLIGFSRDSGLFDPQINLVNYATEWNQYRQSKGQFNGASWQPDVAPPDPTGALFNVLHPDGSYFQGGSQDLADLAVKALGEFDTDARKELVHEAQRINAKSQYSPGTRPGQPRADHVADHPQLAHFPGRHQQRGLSPIPRPVPQARRLVHVSHQRKRAPGVGALFSYRHAPNSTRPDIPRFCRRTSRPAAPPRRACPGRRPCTCRRP